MYRKLLLLLVLFTLSSAQLSDNNNNKNNHNIIDDEAPNIQEAEFSFNSTTANSTESVVTSHHEILNETLADSFHTWLDSKSNELHEMNLKFSGFKLLNEIYNVELKKDAQFAYINFTDMIVNISKSISDVLHNKTRVVKDLSALVESTYDEFSKNDDEIRDSIDALYLDSKSPKTFCDINEMYMAKKEAKKGAKPGAKPADKANSAPSKQRKKRVVREELDTQQSDINEEDDVENEIDQFGVS